MVFLLPRPPQGELFSNQIWAFGPGGSTSLHAAAANLTSVSLRVEAVLAGHQANSGVMLTAWQGQTGELANAADTPQQVWLHATAKQLDLAAAATQTLATAFHTAQMTTPPPSAFLANDVAYPGVLALMFVSFGTIWQPYFLNGMEYLLMTAMAEAAQGTYSSMSTGILAAMQGHTLTASPVSGTPGVGAMSGSMAGGMAGSPLGSLLQGAAGLGAAPGGAASAAVPAVGAATQPFSSVTSLVSQPSNVLGSSGSQLASTAGPMASSPASGLGGMPASAMPPVGSPGNGAGGPGTSDGTWYGAGAGTGGTVAAALTPGGGGAGLGGLGGAGVAMSPLRAPGSWGSSTPTVATLDADQGPGSRFAQTRAAMAGSPTSAGMGSPGTMMPPAARQGQESAAARDKALDAALATAAVLYRPPRDMPVVTGAAGMHYLAGEEDQ
jgi:hypothetical protein